MNKRILAVSMLTMLSMIVVGCGSSSSETSNSSSSSSSSASSSSQPSSSAVTLSTITISGVSDVEIEFQSEFNALTGVTAVGNDSVDYTSSIVLQSTSTALNLTTGALDTTKTGTHAIRYTVTVGAVTSQKWRNVVVKTPTVIPGQLLINGDFSLGTAGWDAALPYYVADGGTMTMSIDDGALKIDVVPGANSYSNRFGQAPVAFLNGKTYQVSFRAKSTAAKTIDIQIGEQFSGAPYFTDFMAPQIVHKVIGLEWTTYSFKYTHKVDNVNASLLFSLGKIGDESVSATMWFDDMNIVESTPDADTEAPIFSGVSASVNLLIGASYDPLSGVSAVDVVDGDVTSSITVEIKNSSDVVVASVDTSVAGTFTVSYSVADKAANVRTATTLVTISAMAFKPANLVANASFAAALNTTTPEWAIWSEAGATSAIDTVAGTYSVTVPASGGAAWSTQLIQDGYLTLEQGKTYRLSFDAHAEAARSVNVAIGYSNPDYSYVQYARKDGISIGTSSTTNEFVFTATLPTHAVKLGVELGNMTGFAAGTVTFEEFRLQERDAAPIIANGKYKIAGWRGFANDWDGSVISSGIVDGEYKIEISKYVVGAEWALQLIQDGVSIGGSSENGVIKVEAGKSYTIGFDAYASEAITIHPYIISSGDWANLVSESQRNVAITTAKTHYEVTATAGATVYGNEILKFQFGDAFAAFEGVTKSICFDNISVHDVAANADLASVYNGNMESIIGGHTFFSDAAENTMKPVSGGAEFNIVTLGAEAYTPHYYYMIDSLAVGNYTVVLTMSSSVARSFRMNLVLPNAGYASILPDTKYDFTLVAGEMTVVTVSFSVSTALTNVKFELDMGTIGGELVSVPTVATIKELNIYQNFNAVD